MKYLKFSLTLYIIVWATHTYAQQSPLLADYYYTPLLINPAFSGYYQNADMSLNGRSQINGIEGSPQTLSFTYHGPLNNKKVGLGGMVIYDKVGVTSKTGVYGTYSFKLLMDYNDYQSDWYYAPQSFTMGLIAGISYYNEDLLEVNLPDDPEFQENISTTIPSVGIGILYNSKHFYIGLSSPDLLEASTSKEKNITIRSNYYLNTGVRIYTSRNMFMEPNVLLKYSEGVPVQMDINLIFNYFNKFEFGGGYRTTSSMNIFAGLYLNSNLRIIYNYTPALNNSPLGHSHGMTIGYRFGNGYGGRLN